MQGRLALSALKPVLPDGVWVLLGCFFAYKNAINLFRSFFFRVIQVLWDQKVVPFDPDPPGNTGCRPPAEAEASMGGDGGAPNRPSLAGEEEEKVEEEAVLNRAPGRKGGGAGE